MTEGFLSTAHWQLTAKYKFNILNQLKINFSDINVLSKITPVISNKSHIRNGSTVFMNIIAIEIYVICFRYLFVNTTLSVFKN